MKKVELYEEELMIALDCLKNYRHLCDSLVKMGFETNITDSGETNLDSAIKKMSEALEAIDE